MTQETTSPATMLETTGDRGPRRSPSATMPGASRSHDPAGRGPRTTFSGLCSVGGAESVGGQVPKRFEFDLKGQQLSCRIEKRDNKKGDLKVVLVAGETTRSVQQTNTSGGVIEVSYKGGLRLAGSACGTFVPPPTHDFFQASRRP